MALYFIRAIVFIVFNIFVIHAQKLLPIQSDAKDYFTCLQSSKEQLTCDISSFLEEFTNLVLQTISEEVENTECGEFGNLDNVLKVYFHEINVEDFDEGGLLEASQLMSQCFRNHPYHDSEFVDALSSFIEALKEKAVSTRNISIPSDDQKSTKVLGRYKRTNETNSSQVTRRKSGPMNVPLSSNSVSAATSNHKNRGQNYEKKKNYIRTSEPTTSIYSLFASSFFENISTSRPLQRLFNSIMMTTLARKNFYYAFYRASKEFGLPNPGIFARTVAQAIGETFHSLSSCSFINIVANSIGQYLYNAEVLNIDNYSNLAAQLANELNKSLANTLVGSRDIFLVQSLATGVVRFLYSLGLFTPRNGFAKYLANELLFSKDNASICQYKAISRLSTRDVFKELPDRPPLENKDLNKVENEKFSSILLKRLMTSNRFPNLFDLQLSAEEASEAAYDYIFQLATSLDLSYSNDIAKEIADAISSRPDNIQSHSFASIVAVSLEKFLLAHSFLTAYNAETLAEAYLEELDQVILTSPSSSYIDVFFKATYRFVIKQYLLDTDNANSFGSLFVNELTSSESSEFPGSFSALENNSSVSMILWNDFPEIYSPTGLSSEKASTRIKEIADYLALNLSPTAGINMEFFTKLFLSTVSKVYFDNPDLKTEGALLETLLEMVSTLLGIIQNSHILAIPEHSEVNLALSKAFTREIF